MMCLMNAVMLSNSDPSGAISLLWCLFAIWNSSLGETDPSMWLWMSALGRDLIWLSEGCMAKVGYACCINRNSALLARQNKKE